MSSSEQTRLASVSHAPAGPRDALRSESYGSSHFFTKSDSFYDVAADDAPLHLVDTLGTLNIHDVPEFAPQRPTEDVLLSAEALAASAAPKLLSSVFERRESITPNPPQIGAFRAAPCSISDAKTTPLTKWAASFVPYSALPLAYLEPDPLMAAQMVGLTTPFALPDEKSPPFSYAPTASGHVSVASVAQNKLHLGGIVSPRVPFEDYISGPENGEFGRFDPKNTGAVGNDSSDFSSDEILAASGTPDLNSMSFYAPLDLPLDVFGTAPLLSGMNLWGQKQVYPMHHVNGALAGGTHGGNTAPQIDSRVPFSGGTYNPYRGNVHKTNNPAHGAVPSPAHGPMHGNGSSTEMDASANANAYHRCQNDQFIAANSRVNVHRKNHNANRRKAEMATKYANATLDDFANDICSICKDQHGCRFLQRHLDLGSDASVSGDTRTDDVATVVFNAIHTQIVELMMDPFGNYLVQKLFEKVTAAQRLVLVRTAAPEFTRIALDAHGTRALQKLIEQVLMPEEVRHTVESLAPHVVALSRDLNGNHVVQKCLQRLRPEHNQFVFDAASASCKEIAMHRHGCCVLQRCLDHGNDAQRQQLSLRVAENATSLSLDPYGNYVVQYVLSRGDECSIGIILDHIRANIVALSVHKFGSNVIEKTLRTRKWSELVTELLLANGAQLLVLLNDAYGNYVLQTALDVANATNLSKLAYSLQPLLPGVKNTPHGRRIFTKIQHIV